MLKRMYIENFTVFAKADLEFGQLNVIHGENGTGKTHLLKLVHHVFRTCYKPPRDTQDRGAKTESGADHVEVGTMAHVHLQEAFGFEHRKELIRFGVGVAQVRGEDEQGKGIEFSVSEQQIQTGTGMRGMVPWSVHAIYVPAQDALTRDPAWLPLFRDHILREEALGIELRLQLMLPKLRSLPQQQGEFLNDLVSAIGWSPGVDREGQVYLERDGSSIPARMAALGHTKLAIPALLMERFGNKPWSLVWDEPEANLNPRLIKVVAKALVDLAAAGVQVFVATHSLFLLRELELLSATRAGKSIDWRHIGLLAGPDGVTVQQGKTAADAGSPVALDESLEQSDRYLKWED